MTPRVLSSCIGVSSEGEELISTMIVPSEMVAYYCWAALYLQILSK